EAERVDVRAVLDAGRKAPRAAQAEAAFRRLRNTRPRALPRDDGQARAAEQLLDGFVLQVRSTRTDRERRSHQHPTRGRIAVRDALDDLERRHGIELEPTAQRARRPHAEQTFAVQRLDDGLGELAELFAFFRMLACQGACALRARDDVRSLNHCVHDDYAPFKSFCNAGRAAMRSAYAWNTGVG